ncbi:MAG: ATP-binding protein [Lactobacillaceae bacterium]|jgi:nucleoside-triphosphatase THEP1|nr:ATP-binding protein [Lactobacillaceae bacterium]
MNNIDEQITNPFTASFGRKPLKTVGRDFLISEVVSVLGNWNSEWRSTIITGVRGSGKTTALMTLRDIFRDKGIITVSTTANEENMLEDIVLGLQRGISASSLTLKDAEINLGVFKIGIGEKEIAKTFKYQIQDLLANVHADETPVVFIIDEINNSAALRVFTTAYQAWLQEGYKVMFLGAGLPWEIEPVLKGKITSFLQRSQLELLVPLNECEVAKDFIGAFEDSGKVIPDKIAQDAAELTMGYPYMFQLIGSKMWELTLPNQVVTAFDLHLAAAYAKAMMFKNVYALLIPELSEFDNVFLTEMSVDEGWTLMSMLRERTGKEINYLSNYRQRLLALGLIVGGERGRVRLALPFLREFMLERFVYTHEVWD